jgi:hypothetical protein
MQENSHPVWDPGLIKAFREFPLFGTAVIGWCDAL